MTDTPFKVSIGIPTWNRCGYLRMALESAMAQSYPELEIVVSDNASTDGTADFLAGLKDSRIRVLRQPENIGGIPNLNQCLQHATGDLFLLLSDDDTLELDAITRLVAPFQGGRGDVEPEKIGLTWCPCRIINPDGTTKWTTAAGPEVERSVDLMMALFGGTRGPRLSSVLIRTKDARRAGGYDLDRYNAICDTANWGAVALEYPFAICVPMPLVSYRVHASSHTSSSVASDWQLWGGHMHEDLAKIVRRRFPSDASKFELVRTKLLANLTIDVMMRGIGASGWIGRSLREVWRSWRYLLTPYVFRRAVVDGVKLFRSK